MALKIVVLGCGFAGFEAALWLHRLDIPGAEVSVVSKSDFMVYTPSIIWIPPKRKSVEEIAILFKLILENRGVGFYQDEVVLIEPQDNSVTLAGGRKLSYEYLVIAAGWQAKRRHIAGSEHILFPCELADTLKLAGRIGSMKQGTITFAVEGERPGPGLEFLGWTDYYLRDMQVRQNFELNLVEEKDCLLEHFGKEAFDAIVENFRKRDIKLYLGRRLKSADVEAAYLEDGTELRSDLICAVGKLEAPALLQRLDFAGEDGFIRVSSDLSSKVYPNIFVAGDAASFDIKGVPKVAHLAIQQGGLAARNIDADIAGKPRADFDAEHAIKSHLTLTDLGDVAILTRGHKIMGQGSYLSSVKESLERYYLQTHRRGLPFNPFGH